ncbi:MAG TPA: DsbA family protein [Longimicrobiaceae bacterium]|nr:DsbA family protein [Longimicrobiaceae bacterium]
MRAKLSDALTLVMVVCAVVVTGLVVRREFFPPAGDTPRAVRQVENWEAAAAEGSLLGSAEAPVRIVEFSDFQCPFCARVQPGLKRLQQEHPGKVTIVYRHLPLQEIHPHAFEAALAAECAGAQGRFEPYHDALFEMQDSIGSRDWGRYAEDAGVADLQEFRQCVAERRFESRVRRDMEEAERIGVRGTPVFIFDGKMISGADAPDQLAVWVREAVRRR